MTICRQIVATLVIFFATPSAPCVFAGDMKSALERIKPPPPAPAGEHLTLPQDHEFQKTLRAFMATLRESDFQLDHTDLTVKPDGATGPITDEQFRAFLLSVSPPNVGYKRNNSSVMFHAGYFTLANIENEKAILRPRAGAGPQIQLADWDIEGNPYRNSRALRLRAFQLCALDLIMIVDLLEHADEKTIPNQDRLAGLVAGLASNYPGFRELLPETVRKAYLEGLRIPVQRLIAHGPKNLPQSLGSFTAPVPALAASAKILDDPKITKAAEDYARSIYTDPQFFRPAGYFPFGGTLDSFNGIALSYAIWGAAVGEWPFAKQAIDKAHRLRAHLTLPDPDGFFAGPSHFSALTSPEPVRDQWNWAHRTWNALMLTDEALCLVKIPDENAIRHAPRATAESINGGLHELSWAPHGLESAPWACGPGGGINAAYSCYPKGFYKRLPKLIANEANLLPVLRKKDFVTRFEDEFLVAKQGDHAVIIHTGPITDPADPDAGYGFGGGALSAFWTRNAGSVILGRGMGAWAPAYKTLFDNWRSLPTHAVTGVTSTGKVFTSAHIVKPDTVFDVKGDHFSVKASGLIPATRKNEPLFDGSIQYARSFESTDAGVHIVTQIKPETTDKIAELYETLPIYFTDPGDQAKVLKPTIEFHVDGKWTEGADTPTDNVTAVRVHRFEGSVLIAFKTPANVRLAPLWTDTYMTHVQCRNLLIDINSSRSIGYRIEALK